MKFTISFEAFCTLFDMTLKHSYEYRNIRKGLRTYIKNNWYKMDYKEQTKLIDILKSYTYKLTEIDKQFWDELYMLQITQTTLL